MRTLVLIAVILLAAPWVRSRLAPVEAIATQYLNGNLRTNVETTMNASGDRIRDGRYGAFYEDGAAACSGTFRHGRREGLWQWWDPDGQPLGECLYHHDDGIFTSRDAQGRVVQQGPMHLETRTGIWTEFYPSGRKKLTGEFRDGKQHGLWTFTTDEDPPRSSTTVFENGRQVR